MNNHHTSVTTFNTVALVSISVYFQKKINDIQKEFLEKIAICDKNIKKIAYFLKNTIMKQFLYEKENEEGNDEDEENNNTSPSSLNISGSSTLDLIFLRLNDITERLEKLEKHINC